MKPTAIEAARANLDAVESMLDSVLLDLQASCDLLHRVMIEVSCDADLRRSLPLSHPLNLITDEIDRLLMRRTK